MLRQIYSTKEESDMLLLMRSVFKLSGMATGLREAKEWRERKKRGWLEKTEVFGNTKSTTTTKQ